MTDIDEGELIIAVSSSSNVIRVDFGKSLEWFAMSPEQAIGIAQLLMKHAERQKNPRHRRGLSSTLNPKGENQC